VNRVFNKRRATVLSPWVTLVTRTVSAAFYDSPQEFHSLQPADYVSVFAVTSDGRIPLVRQYRPALDRHTLELPSGLLGKNEKPRQSAARELFEETGCRAGPRLHALGVLSPDTGRLENRLWAFAATHVTRAPSGWEPERGVECVIVSKREFKRLILNGDFDHAMNLAVIMLAVLQGRFAF